MENKGQQCQGCKIALPPPQKKKRKKERKRKRKNEKKKEGGEQLDIYLGSNLF